MSQSDNNCVGCGGGCFDCYEKENQDITKELEFLRNLEQDYDGGTARSDKVAARINVLEEYKWRYDELQ